MAAMPPNTSAATPYTSKIIIDSVNTPAINPEPVIQPYQPGKQPDTYPNRQPQEQDHFPKNQ